MDAVILAAGQGKRMRSSVPKALTPFCGVTLLENCARILRASGIERLIVVAAPALGENDELRQILSKFGAQMVAQPRPLGTADAAGVALAAVQSDAVVIAPADMPLMRASAVKSLIDARAEANAELAFLTARKRNAQGFGRVTRDQNGAVASVVEEIALTDAQKEIGETNAGWYCVAAQTLKELLPRVQTGPTGEKFLTDLVELAARRGAVATVERDELEALGVNDQIQLAQAKKARRRRIVENLMRAGASIDDPDNVAIDMDVKVGANLTIVGAARIEGASVIGNGCRLAAGALIQNATLGDNVTVDGGRVQDSALEDGAAVGAGSAIHSGSVVKAAATIGVNAEIKNSQIGEGAKIKHFAYIGDADIGRNVNIGAGAVTCNYDGKQKHATRIEDDAFIGAGALLVAPVRIGRASVIGAGSVVTRDVDARQKVAGAPARPLRAPDLSQSATID